MLCECVLAVVCTKMLMGDVDYLLHFFAGCVLTSDVLTSDMLTSDVLTSDVLTTNHHTRRHDAPRARTVSAVTFRSPAAAGHPPTCVHV